LYSCADGATSAFPTCALEEFTASVALPDVLAVIFPTKVALLETFDVVFAVALAVALLVKFWSTMILMVMLAPSVALD